MFRGRSNYYTCPTLLGAGLVLIQIVWRNPSGLIEKLVHICDWVRGATGKQAKYANTVPVSKSTCSMIVKRMWELVLENGILCEITTHCPYFLYEDYGYIEHVE